jgi:hypothetical protein
MGTIIFLVPLAFVGAAYVWMMHELRKKGIEHQQGLISQAFSEHALRHADLKDAVLVRRTDEVRGGDYVYVQTHRIYRTVGGLYFLFICTSGEKGYSEPLSRERAANALRSSPDIYRDEFPNGVQSSRIDD